MSERRGEYLIFFYVFVINSAICLVSNFPTQTSSGPLGEKYCMSPPEGAPRMRSPGLQNLQVGSVALTEGNWLPTPQPEEGSRLFWKSPRPTRMSNSRLKELSELRETIILLVFHSKRIQIKSAKGKVVRGTVQDRRFARLQLSLLMESHGQC